PPRLPGPAPSPPGPFHTPAPTHLDAGSAAAPAARAGALADPPLAHPRADSTGFRERSPPRLHGPAPSPTGLLHIPAPTAGDRTCNTVNIARPHAAFDDAGRVASGRAA